MPGSEIFRLGVLVLMDGDEQGVGVGLHYFKAVLHIADLLVPYALDSLIVEGNVLGPCHYHVKARKLQHTGKVGGYRQIYVFFNTAVHALTAAVYPAVTAVYNNSTSGGGVFGNGGHRKDYDTSCQNITFFRTSFCQDSACP